MITIPPRHVREMTIDDALYVIRHMRASDRAAMRAIQPAMTDEQFAIDRLHTTFRFTLLDGLTPTVIGGANVTPSGTAVAWMVATDQIHNVAKPLLRTCRDFVKALFSEKHVHRLEGYVLAGVPECKRFAEAFDLEFEGIRRKAGANGEDILMYGRV